MRSALTGLWLSYDSIFAELLARLDADCKAALLYLILGSKEIKTTSDTLFPIIVVGQPTNRGGGVTRKLGAICFLKFVIIETLCS